MEPLPLVVPTKEFECPVCLGLMRDPVLNNCCGQHFCADCIAKVTNAQGPCPLCNQKKFEIFPNKHFERNLKNLQASCSQQPDGCPWEGTVGEFAGHYRQCDYVHVACSNECGVSVKRKLLDYHRGNECPLRKSACEHCGLEGSHQFVTGVHRTGCPNLPVQCPNGCNSSVPRTEIPAHLSECSHQSVRCSFQQVGCVDEFRRSELGAHMQEHVTKHVSLVCYSFRTFQDSLLAKVEEKDRHIAELEIRISESDKQITELERRTSEKDKRIETLERRLLGLESYISSCLLPGNLPALFTTTLNGFTKFRANNDIWFSRPFYTGPIGYKMCLKVHTATESDMAVHLCAQQGEFDDSLTWPLTAEVTVELVSHVGNNHHRMKRRASWSKVASGGRGAGFGWGNFIAYKNLTTKDCSYVKEDCLTFRVVCFDIVS